MAQWVLKCNGMVVPRRSLRPLQVAEVHSSEEKERRKIFDACIARKLGTSVTPPSQGAIDELQTTWEQWGDEGEELREVPETKDTVDASGRLLDQQPAYDRLINAEVHLQLGDTLKRQELLDARLAPMA
jgi:hypothetical protein